MSTVLIVDDQPDICDLLAVFAADAGCASVCARDGREGLAMLAAHEVGLMILDNHMPGMSGLDLLRTVRGEPGRRLPHTVMFTGDAASCIDAIALGVDECLVKSEWVRLRGHMEACACRRSSSRS